MTEPEETEERALVERLGALREDPPAELGFQATLHRRLVAAGPPEPAPGWDRVRWLFRRGTPWLWPLLGAAAGVAAFLLMSALQQPPAPPSVVAEASRPLAVPGTQVPVSKVAVIKLDFTADVAVEQANFQVSLPEGLSFWADGKELALRSFEWTQALSAGSNVIPIAVRGQKPGRYLVMAQARTGDQRIEHEVVLEVTDG